jgi:hypothetical protein
MFPQAFLNILKEPLLVQKQTIPQKKFDTQLFGAGKFNPVWHGTGHFYPVEFVRSDFFS